MNVELPTSNIQPRTADDTAIELATRLQGLQIELELLRQYVMGQARLADKSWREWEQAYPGCVSAAYRSGMWYGYHDLQERLFFLCARGRVLPQLSILAALDVSGRESPPPERPGTEGAAIPLSRGQADGDGDGFKSPPSGASFHCATRGLPTAAPTNMDPVCLPAADLPNPNAGIVPAFPKGRWTS